MRTLNEYQLAKSQAVLDAALERGGLLLTLQSKTEAAACRFKLYRARTADRQLNDDIIKGENPEASDYTSPYDSLVMRIIRAESNWCVKISLDEGTDMNITDLTTGEQVDV